MKNLFNLDKITEPEQILIADPIRDSTRISRRNLLFSTVVILLAIAYGADTINIPIINLPAEALIGVLGCMVVYHLIGFIINYTNDIQAWVFAQKIILGKELLQSLIQLSDRMSEVTSEFNRIEAHLISHEKIYKEQIKFVTEPVLHFIETGQVPEGKNEIEHYLKKYIEILERYAIPEYGKSTEISKASRNEYKDQAANLDKVLEYFSEESKNFNKKVKHITRATIRLRIYQWLKIYVWEGGVPLILASIAVLGSYSSITTFIQNLIGNLIFS